MYQFRSRGGPAQGPPRVATPGELAIRFGMRPYTVRNLILSGRWSLAWHRGRPLVRLDRARDDAPTKQRRPSEEGRRCRVDRFGERVGVQADPTPERPRTPIRRALR